MGIYSNLCGSCIHLDPNDRKSSEFKYYCDKYHAYYTLTDSCRYYEEAKGRNHDELYKKDNPSGCYITTILCDILNTEDNHKYLQLLRRFRDLVLQKEPRYASILMEYDVIGPVIANNIKNDPNAHNLSTYFTNNYILPIVSMIEQKEFDLAIAKYIEMVNILKNAYSIRQNGEVVDYDYTNGGHGYVFTKKIIRA